MFGFGFDTLIGQFVNRAVHEVAGARMDPLAASVLRWVGNVQEHVLRRWYPVTRAGIRCALRPKDPNTGRFVSCPHVAVGACTFCKQPTCLHHAMVNEVAEIACYRCMAECVEVMRARHPDWQTRPDFEAEATRREVPPSNPPEHEDREKRKRHLKALGLKDPTSWEEIHATFRELSVKLHPDRAPNPAKRAHNERKFKAISEAYAWFNERRERAAAA